MRSGIQIHQSKPLPTSFGFVSRNPASGGPSGPSLRSFSLDGVAEGITTDSGYHTLLGVSSGAFACSFVLWYKPNGAFATDDSIFAGDFNPRMFRLYYNGSKLRFGWQNPAFAGRGVTAASDPTVDAWNFVACTVTDNGVVATYKIYMNSGTVDASNGPAGSGFTIYDDKIDIGREGNVSHGPNGIRHFAGWVHNFGFWNVELTQPQVAALYALGGQGDYADVLTPTMYLRGTADDDLTAANGVLDSSGNGYTATAENMEAEDLTEDLPT